MYLTESRFSRRLVCGIALCLLTLAALLSPASLRAQTNIQEYSISSSAYSAPYGLTYGQDSNIWFTEYFASGFGYFNTATNMNFIQDYRVTNFMDAGPFGIVSAPDGNIWFTMFGSNQVAKIVNKTNYTAYTLPGVTNGPAKLIVGPDNNLWFVEFMSNKIASITLLPTIVGSNTLVLNHEYGPFRTNSQIYGLTTGPDGNLWFTETSYGIITKLNPTTGATNEYVLPDTNSGPYGIVSGPDGALWFTEFGTNRIGRITTGGTITEFNLSPGQLYNGINPKPLDIILGWDGNLWFTEYNTSSIGKITTNGIVTLFPTPTGGSFPTYLTTGPTAAIDSNIWFGEFVNGPPAGQAYGNLARLNLAQALDLSVTNTLNFLPNTMTVSNSAVIKNSRLHNIVSLNWGDGLTSSLEFDSLTNVGTSLTNIDSRGSIVVTCTSPIGTNFNVGSYSVNFTHTFAKLLNYTNTLRVVDFANNSSVALLTIPASTFFNGQVFITNNNASGNVYSLTFPSGSTFGYYNDKYFPYLYHYGLGFEYFIDANDGASGAYLYDFTSGHFWYTSPSVFPYIYDFTLNSWLYYDPASGNPRYFYDFNTASFITQ